MTFGSTAYETESRPLMKMRNQKNQPNPYGTKRIKMFRKNTKTAKPRLVRLPHFWGTHSKWASALVMIAFATASMAKDIRTIDSRALRHGVEMTIPPTSGFRKFGIEATEAQWQSKKNFR